LRALRAAQEFKRVEIYASRQADVSEIENSGMPKIPKDIKETAFGVLRGIASVKSRAAPKISLALAFFSRHVFHVYEISGPSSRTCRIISDPITFSHRLIVRHEAADRAWPFLGLASRWTRACIRLDRRAILLSPRIISVTPVTV